ncbi:MAG: endosialidase [Firmicutes bacterium]|nr:endosialidase [Bacillota bacterium]
MSVIEEFIRVEENGAISFGNYLTESKRKVVDFEVDGDLYYVKTYNEITRLEKNSKLLLETVPGAAIHNLVMNEKKVSFTLEGEDNIHVTMELEPEAEYRVFVDDFNVGRVSGNVSGKVDFSVDVKNSAKNIILEKAN